MQLMLEHLDPNDIQDLEQARRAIIQVLNLVEELATAMSALREENQRLRDENNRLKGEQGKPTIKPSRNPRSSQASDHSSEPERRCRKERTRRSKVDSIPMASALRVMTGLLLLIDVLARRWMEQGEWRPRPSRHLD